MEVQLRVKTEGKPDQKVTISKNVTVGRSKTCQFRVMSNDVSREHCQFIMGENSFAVRDLGSANGTQVNGQTIPAQTDFPVASGAVVDIGPLKFLVKYQSPVSAPVTEPVVTAPPEAAAASVQAPVAKKPVAAKPKPAAPKPVPVEPTLPVVAKNSTEPSEPEGFSWPTFGDDADQEHEQTFISPPVESSPAVVSESKSDITQQEPVKESAPLATTEPPPAPVPAVVSSAAAPASEPTASAPTPAPIEAADSSEDAPAFFLDTDNEPCFSFDTADAETIAAVEAPTAETSAAAPAPTTDKPSKLKSLFGLFSKGKKAAAPAAPTTPVVESAPAASSAPEATEHAWFAGPTDDDAAVPDFLIDTAEAPVAAAEPAPVPAPAPTPKPVAATPKAKAKPAEKKPAPKPAAPPPTEEVPSFSLGGEADGDEGVADFLSQLGN